MNKIFFLLMIVAFLTLSFHQKRNDISQTKILIRVVNESKFNLKDISLFSVKFNNLKIKEKSKFKELNFNKNSDDAMIYLTANNKRFALYITAVSEFGKHSYIIDSLNMERRYIHLRQVMK